MGEKLTNQQVLELELPGWRPLLGRLHTRISTRDFVTGLDLVNAIGAAAEAMNHHPDLDLRYGHLDVALSSHDVGGITERDVTLARRISQLADEGGMHSRPELAQTLEIALDTADRSRIMPFWQAVYGLSVGGGGDEVVDPDGVLPSLWFQDTDAHGEPRQRFHLDVWVPTEVAAGRIAGAVAAGGTLVSDAEAPSFTVLADPDGNRVCICTNAGR
jgi:4a-hydroxytetrahydrobiopterin dehydratase